MNQSAIRALLSGAALLAALGTGLAFAQSLATPPGPGGPRGSHCGPGSPGMHHGAMMNWLDTDADGQISRAELEAANQARLARELNAFDAADVSKDGKLSRDEMKAFRDAMRAQRGPGGSGCAPGGSGGPGGRPAAAPPAKPEV